jgi:hypothetical protein
VTTAMAAFLPRDAQAPPVVVRIAHSRDGRADPLASCAGVSPPDAGSTGGP